GDLADAGALERLLAGAGAVVHVAGLVRARDAARFMHVNRDATAALGAATRRVAGGARLVAVSSLAARAPQLSAYAASKRAGEAALRAAYADAPERLVIVRPPAIYGPGDQAMLPLFRAARRGLVPVFATGPIALVHVADAAAAIARLALGAGEAGCHALADPNPAGYPLAALLAELGHAVGRRPWQLRLPGGALLAAGAAASLWMRLGGPEAVFSLGKAREVLHADWSVAPAELLADAVYRSRIGLAEGLRATAAWYRAAGWLR
ncbi:MAG: NAD-dependent epimerase/dehydratase family protein, partial [Acetobacteraceae bacterium]